MSTYNGKYTDSGNNSDGNNVLSDARLVKRQSDSSLDYRSYSIGRRPGYKKPAPTVQAKGNIQNGQ